MGGQIPQNITYQRCTREGALAVANQAAIISEAEFFAGHAKTAYMRLEKYGSESN